MLKTNYEISGKITQRNWKNFDPSQTGKSFFYYFKKTDSEENLKKKLEYSKTITEQIRDHENKIKKEKLEELKYDRRLTKKIDKDIKHNYSRFLEEINYDTPIQPLKDEKIFTKIKDFEDGLNIDKNKIEIVEKINFEFSDYSILSKKSNKNLISNFLIESYQKDNKNEKSNLYEKCKKGVEIFNVNDISCISENFKFKNNYNKENKIKFETNNKLPLCDQYDILDNLKKNHFQGKYKKELSLNNNFLNLNKDFSKKKKKFSSKNKKFKDISNDNNKKNKHKSNFNDILNLFKNKNIDCSDIIEEIENFSSKRSNFKILSTFN